MKTLKITLLLMVLISVTSCRKKHTITIQAHNLVNSSDGSHYAGMKYIIVERRVGAFENKYKTVKEGVLDENGYANFDLRMHFNRTYDLGIQEPENICYTEVTIKYPLKDGQNNVVNFNYAPCGYVNLQRKSINCEGATDKFGYKYYYNDNPEVYYYTGFVSGSDHHWNNSFFLEGCNDYLGDFSEKRPSGKYTIEWIVERPSGTTNGSGTFVITEGDTTNYLIEY